MSTDEMPEVPPESPRSRTVQLSDDLAAPAEASSAAPPVPSPVHPAVASPASTVHHEVLHSETTAFPESRTQVPLDSVSLSSADPSSQSFKVASPARFATSPLDNGVSDSSSSSERNSPPDSDISSGRSRTDALPSLGEEGAGNAAVRNGMTENVEPQAQDHRANTSAEPAISPAQTGTVDEAVPLFAPKPELPPSSAEQRVQTVTRTDSIVAASFGIGVGKSSTGDIEMQKKISTAGYTSGNESLEEDGENGIPEIGRQVPMLPFAGDVQAPSPAPGSMPEPRPSLVTRRNNTRGPPGSYGQHGHGLYPKDKLDQAYYEKYPDRFDQERVVSLHDRQKDYAMSRENLDKIVRDTASQGSGLATSEFKGTPSEDDGFQAHQLYSPMLKSQRPETDDEGNPDLLPSITSHEDLTPSRRAVTSDGAVRARERRRSSVSFQGDEHAGNDLGDLKRFKQTPIIAPDEAAKGLRHDLMPAVKPTLERSGSAFEIEQPSRPLSRPNSVYDNSKLPHEAPLDEHEEYEPLFQPDSKIERHENDPPNDIKGLRHLFPSKDVWEDAPHSVHHTAELSTSDLNEQNDDHRESRMPLPESTPNNIELPNRPGISHRFPSRDVWEDVPDSHMQEAIVSAPQGAAESPKAEVPAHPVKELSDSQTVEKPVVPDRPKVKQWGNDQAKGNTKAATTEPAKPFIPSWSSRPATVSLQALVLPTSSPETVAGAAPKAKPLVPTRPLGSKIAALQATFMSDLNRKLQIGPQAPKREDSTASAANSADEERSLLADSRKSRARGPQRRAPACGSQSDAPLSLHDGPRQAELAFSDSSTFWAIDPSHGSLAVDMGLRRPVGVGDGGNAQGSEATAGPLNTDAVNASQESAADQKAADHTGPMVVSDVIPARLADLLPDAALVEETHI